MEPPHRRVITAYHANPMSAEKSVFASARLLAIGTLLSRVTGLARDMLLSQTFGLTYVADAFNFAFQLPNLARRLFGEGALAAAFVPVFTRAIENDGRPAAWRMLAGVLSLLTLTLLALLALAYVALLGLWWLGGDSESNRLLLHLTAIMLPFLLTICVVALLASVLNCVHSFLPGALLPIALNLAMIVGMIGLGPLWRPPDNPSERVYAVAWSVLFAGVLQLFLIYPVLRANGVRLGWRIDSRDPHVRSVIYNMGPVLLGQGVLVLGPLLDSIVVWCLSGSNGHAQSSVFSGEWFEPPLDGGALAALTNAQRLYQFPLGVLAISLATAALPRFSRLANAGDRDAWAAEVTRSFRMAIFIGLLTGLMMVVWGAPIVRLLFQYRQFDAEDTARVAAVMIWYGLGLWAFCAQHIVIRGFYSLGDVRTPVKLSCIMIPLSLVLSVLLVWTPLRESAFAVSAATCSALLVLTGMFLLQKRAGRPLLTIGTLRGILAMLLCAIIAGLVLTWLGRSDLPRPLTTGPEWLQRFVETGGGLAIGCLVFLAAAGLLKLPEAAAGLALGRRDPRSG